MVLQLRDYASCGGVSAEGLCFTVEGSASFPEEAITTHPVAETKAAVDEDDDSDVDLFGEETKEEKKAAEDRAAALKASGKKKECNCRAFVCGEVEGMNQGFDLMDTNKQGKIDFAQLKARLQKLGHQIRDADVQILTEAVTFHS